MFQPQCVCGSDTTLQDDSRHVHHVWHVELDLHIGGGNVWTSAKQYIFALSFHVFESGTSRHVRNDTMSRAARAPCVACGSGPACRMAWRQWLWRFPLQGPCQLPMRRARPTGPPRRCRPARRSFGPTLLGCRCACPRSIKTDRPMNQDRSINQPRPFNRSTKTEARG